MQATEFIKNVSVPRWLCLHWMVTVTPHGMRENPVCPSITGVWRLMNKNPVLLHEMKHPALKMAWDPIGH